MTAETLTGVRASNLVSCLRKGWYDAQEIEKDELSKKTLRLFKIRQMQNDALALDMQQEAAAAGRSLILEDAIPWGPTTTRHPNGIWEAHADIADEDDCEIWELTGSADLSPDRRKMLQSAFYAKRKTEITGRHWRAFVLVFNPSTGEDRKLEINWPEMVWEVDVLIADLRAYMNSGTEPPRVNSAGDVVCTSPHDGPAMFCPYARWCFRDYEYPTLGTLQGPLAQIAVEVAALSEQTNTTLLDKDRKEKGKRLAAGLSPKTKYRVPVERGVEIEVSYSEIPGRVTVSLKEMEDAGFKLPAELEQFVKRGEPSIRVNTKRMEVPVQ